MAYPGATTTALRDQISHLLTDRITGLTLDQAHQLTETFASHGRGAGPLRDYLLGHPQVLTTTDSDIPLALVDIAYALRQAGRTDIVPPACLDCGATSLIRNVVPGGRVCNSCRHRRRRLTCTRCDKPVGPSPAVTAAGGLCRSCRAATKPAEACANCRRTVKIDQRLADGTGLCQRCATRPTRACSHCGHQRPVHAHTSDGPVCLSCYQRPLHPCGRCGRIAEWHTRPRDGQPGYCVDCHRRPTAACTSCGNIRPLSRSEHHDGARMCDLCRARQQPCDLCHRTARIIARWPIGAACHTCYQKTRRTLLPCPDCGQPQPLVGLSAQGQRICAGCANLGHDYTCARCGAAGQFPINRTCYDCLAGDRVTELIGPAAPSRTDLRALAAAILASGTGMAVWQRLHPRGIAARQITAIVAADTPLSHELLDTLPQRQALHRLRADLVHGGALPQRVEFLDRIGPWLDRQLTDLPDRHARLIRTWAQWTLQPRARRRLAHRPFTEPAAHYQRAILTAAIRFLRWIDTQNLTLTELTQPDIDRWITGHPHEYSYQAKEFLRWARDRGLTGDVAITERTQAHNPTALTEDEQWRHLRRCLSDDTLPADVRVAASLNLLYGLTISRISRLRTDEINHTNSGTYLHIGTHELRLTDPLAELLHAHLDTITGYATGQLLLDQASAPQLPRSSATAASTSGWLFPGGQPGRHTVTLHRRLARHGMPHAAHGRAAALIHLAADLPAPVLVDLLGISIDTANQWAKHASSDWATYVAAR